MEKFRYKEYSEDETLVYNKAMDRIMDGLGRGLSFDDACNSVNVEDHELKAYIFDDALKVMIADLHYTKGQPLEYAADFLKLPFQQIEKAHGEMMEDISVSVSEVYNLSNPEAPAGNA